MTAMTSLADPDHEVDADMDAALRLRWRDLVGNDLPAAAANHPDWPICLDHCFARVILDAVHGRPWREAIAAPAWRHMTPGRLRAGIALGEGIVAGTVDVAALNARSLTMRRAAKDSIGCGNAR